MTRKVKVAAIQMSCAADRNVNIDKAEKFVIDAAKQGAQIILLPELFETTYFCQEKSYDNYDLACSIEENTAIQRLTKIAKEYKVVLPVSFYEKAGNNTFNSIVVIDATGENLGLYRKTHIPDDHFYQEKFYFTPGDTGFKVFKTAYGNIGVGICWDQWFPEAARCMALLGAEMLFYPTAIGSEPILDYDSMPHWRRCMQGHSGSNIMPVIAANRIGLEKINPNEDNANQESSLNFYGSSFITDQTGEIIESADRESETILTSEFDLDEIHKMRLSWGVFRDRRPECYSLITSPINN